MTEKDASSHFVHQYRLIYDRIREEYLTETGSKLAEYKPYEPELLKDFFLYYEDRIELVDQMACLLSKLILLQALPNANHRTAFRFVSHYAQYHGCEITVYKSSWRGYDDFYAISKRLVPDVSSHHLFRGKLVDAHHDLAITAHLAVSRELIEKISSVQSGMIEAVPFHRFVSKLTMR